MFTRRAFTLGSAAALASGSLSAKALTASPSAPAIEEREQFMMNALDTIAYNFQAAGTERAFIPALLVLNHAILETDPRWAGGVWRGIDRATPIQPLPASDPQSLYEAARSDPTLRCRTARLAAPAGQKYHLNYGSYGTMLGSEVLISEFEAYVEIVSERVRDKVWSLDAAVDRDLGPIENHFIPIDAVIVDARGLRQVVFRSHFRAPRRNDLGALVG